MIIETVAVIRGKKVRVEVLVTATRASLVRIIK